MPDSVPGRLSDRAVYPDRPYRGLSFFTSNDVLLFGERDEEITDAATIVGLPATRVLLLHGLSGVGKSSFLRAGLLPALARETFFECPRTASSEFDLIRCTDDPILRLARAIETWNSVAKTGNVFEDEKRAAVLGELQAVTEGEDRIPLAKRIVRALLVHASDARRTLIITIDQAEEVLTLGSDADPLNRKTAFFDFLLQLCALHVDLKLIISLRTEYYGQFSSAFGLDPASRHATRATNVEEHRARAGTGPDAYLLRPIRDPKKLENIILRPTSKEDRRNDLTRPRDITTKHDPGQDVIVLTGTSRALSPFDKYHFEFSNDGVVRQIVLDLLGRSTTISTLPVLQVVCRSLHEHVVIRRKANTITMNDYVSLGGVDGRVGAYIDEAIGEALLRASSIKLRRSGVLARAVQMVRPFLVVGSPTDRWREILCDLVGQSEGGATTTRIQDEPTLVQRAHEIGFDRQTAKSVLRTLAHERWGVLRLVSGGTMRRYSLMHDAIAAVLERWRQRFQQRLEVQRRTAKWVKVGVAASALLAAFSVGAAILYESYIKPSSVLESATSTLREHLMNLDRAGASSDTSAEVAARNVLGAIEYPRSFVLGRWLIEGWFMPTAEAQNQLKAFAERSPSYSVSASAVGINPEGTLTARMRVAAIPGLPRKVENRQLREYEVEVRQINTGQVVTFERLRIESSAPSFVPPAIGFIGRDTTPTIYHAGRVYQIAGGKWRMIDLVPPPDTSLPAPDGTLDFLTYGFAEVVEQGIRLLTFSGKHRSLYLVNPPFGAAELQARRPTTKALALDSDGRYFPTPAMGVDYFAGLKLDKAESGDQFLKLRVGSVGSDEARELSIAKVSADSAMPWLGYTPRASHALIRTSETVVHALPLGGRPAPDVAIPFELPVAARTASIRGNNWERPQLAGFLGARNLVAWPLESGIMLAELSQPQSTAPSNLARILIDGSQSGRAGFSRLRFSVDGRFLIATTTLFGGDAGTRLQVWDLHSTSTLKDIEEIKGAACAILIATRRGSRDPNGTFMFEGRTLRDPCHQTQ